MSSSRSLVAASLALALLPGCDTPRAPRPDLFGTVLRMRQAQTFHAMPPEAPVTLPVRRVSERAAATRADAVAERDTVMPFAVLAAAGRRTLEVGPIEVTLARGDSLPLHALVRDEAGAIIAGAASSWRSLDPRVLDVRDGVARPRRVGTATLVASWSGIDRTVTVHVRPALSLRVVDVDGLPVAAARLVVRSADREDTLRTDATGRVRLAEQVPEVGALRIDVPAVAARGLRAARLTLDVEAMADEEGIVLVPARWRVEGGRLAGLEVPLEPRAALRPQGESFARLTREEGAGARVVGWAARRLPLRVGSSRELADADTARFWAAAREVERELGMRLFVPAPPGGESDLTIRVATGVPGAAVTQASWAGNGDVMEAEILLRGASVLHDRRVVAHELVHALGFGHTTAWRSIVAPASAPATSWLTPEDVAWVQLVYRLRETQRRVGAAFGLDAALAALPP